MALIALSQPLPPQPSLSWSHLHLPPHLHLFPSPASSLFYSPSILIPGTHSMCTTLSHWLNIELFQFGWQDLSRLPSSLKKAKRFPSQRDFVHRKIGPITPTATSDDRQEFINWLFNLDLGFIWPSPLMPYIHHALCFGNELMMLWLTAL